MRRAAELAPGSKAAYNQGWIAVRLNRPQEAIDALLTLDPKRGPMRRWPSYFAVLCRAYTDLTLHEQALETARKYQEHLGVNASNLRHEAVALVGLGRVDEIDAIIDELVALPDQGTTLGNRMLEIYAYMRRLGHMDVANRILDRAIQGYESRTPETKTTPLWRWWYAWALSFDDRCDEAHDAAEALSDDFPDNINYRGGAAIFAACNGEREEALQISDWFETLSLPYLRGNHTAWRTMIAGALGEGQDAVALWRQAEEEGATHRIAWNGFWIVMEPISDYEPWQELMRPKG
jgi:hypothetical protein